MSVFMGATTKPFQFVEVVGVAGIGLGMLIVIAALVWWSTLLAMVGIGLGLWGFTTTIVGLIGDYLVGMNYEIGRKPKYLVRRFHE